jgi:hypothetical protein
MAEWSISMTVLVMVFVVFLAGAISGLAGFGSAIVSVPVLMVLMPPKTVVPLVQLISSTIHVFVLADAWKALNLRRIWPLIVAGVSSVPLGTCILLLLDASTLRLLVGVTVVLCALAMFLGFQRPVRRERLMLVLVGLLSGALNGSTGMGGPPVILFLTNQDVEKQSFRVNLIFYFACLGVVSLISQYVGGLLTSEVMKNWLMLAPVAALGTWTGIKLSKRTDQQRFRQITLGILMVTGASAIASSLGLF